MKTWTILLIDFSIITLAICCIIQSFWLSRLSRRIRMLEHASFLRGWLQAVEDGEILSDMAYMKEKGFLK